MGDLPPVESRQVMLQKKRAKSRLGRHYGIGSGAFQSKFVVAKRQKVKLVPADSEEAAAIPKRKVTKVGVTQRVADPDKPDQIIVAPQNPNQGTPFESVTFLSPGPHEDRRKLTEEKLQEALFILRDGGSLGDAADIVGVGKTSLIHLAERNPNWAAAMAQATAMGKLEHIRRVKGGDSNWQSSAWWLERRYRAEFGQNAAPPEEMKQIRVRQVIRPPQSLEGKPVLNLPTSEDLMESAQGFKPGEAKTNVANGVDKIIDQSGEEIQVKHR